jgi:HK97 family phage major capsid protein
MLTEEKVAAGFKAAGDRMSDLDSRVSESLECIKELRNQLKLYGASLISGVRNGQGYKGFWPNENMAKEFGEHIFKMFNMKTMGTADRSAVVSTDISNWIIQKMGQYSKFRKYAVNVRMGNGSQIVPKVTSDLTIFCPGETNTINASDIRIAMVTMTARKFACMTVFSRELEQDSIIGLAELIGISIARSMAKKEDEIGFMGDGTTGYFGMTGICGKMRAIDEDITKIPGLIVGSGNAYDELQLGDFRKVVGVLPDDADDNARWFMNKKFYYNVVYPLAETAGNASIFEILSDRKDKFLLGYPVEFVSCMPSTAANSQICAILGDLELGAILSERHELDIARSDDVFFGNDLVAIRGTERIDVSAHGVGDKDDAGAIVALATAAS